MKQLLNLKEKDSGIAIMFSLMMMAVFLVLGMGFSAYMSNIRRAAEYQKDFKSNKDIEDILVYQIRAAMLASFPNTSSYPDDGTSNTQNYCPSLPEGSPSFFDGYVTLNYDYDGADNYDIIKTSDDVDIEFATWGVKTETSAHALADKELLFNMYIPKRSSSTDVYTTNSTIFIKDDSSNDNEFSSPVGGSLGWQEHADENDEVYAISTWATLAMSGRLDPEAYSDTANNQAARATGLKIDEMSVNDIIPAYASAAAGTGSGSIGAMHSAMDAGANSLDETAYYSFFPMGDKYNIEMLNESDYLTQTDKEMDNDPSTSNGTLFDLSAITNTTDPEEMVGKTTPGTALTYLTDPSSSSSLTEVQRIQVAANIKDYIDSDFAASTDYVVGAATEPTYVGNELAPYINELKFTASADYTDDGINTTSGTLDIDLQVELAKIYDDTPALVATDELIIKFDIQFNIQAQGFSNLQTQSKTVTIAGDDFVFTADTTYASRGYYTSPLLLTPLITFTENFPSSAINNAAEKITNVKITLTDAVVLKNGANYLDIGTPVNTTTDTKEILAGFSANCHTQVNDPKFNHSSSEWSALTWEDGTSGTGDSLNSKNTSVISNSNGDNEPDASNDPMLYSTNYIRNSNIKNLHELGYIHRGSPHQTLNLIEYNTETPETISDYTNSNSDVLYNSSLAFADLSNGGDRSILDYVSLGNNEEQDADGNGLLFEEYTPNIGRINPNTTHPAALKMLFSNISADHPASSTNRVGELASVINLGVIDTGKVQSLISQFPGIDSTRTNKTIHKDDGNKVYPTLGYFDPIWFKNLKNNPPSYGVPFKLTTSLTDREAEVLLCNTRRFVSVNRNYYLASIMVDGDTNTAATRSGSASQNQYYIVRELIDDAKSSSDSNASPHDPSDDRYRIRMWKP